MTSLSNTENHYKLAASSAGAVPGFGLKMLRSDEDSTTTINRFFYRKRRLTYFIFGFCVLGITFVILGVISSSSSSGIFIDEHDKLITLVLIN